MNKEAIEKKWFMLCIITVFLFGILACGNKMDDEAAKAALKALDIAECNNLMSLHSWYHAAMQNDVELEKIWSKRDDIIWAQTMGYWKGMESIKKYYGQKSTKDVTKGGYVWHTITSGVVEIAEDRETAKGIWYTPGGGGQAKNGKLDFGWMWEKYGVDFIREDGKWKIWHMKVYTDWAMPLYESSGGQGMGQAPPSGSGGPPPNGPSDQNNPPPQAIQQNTADMVGSEVAPQQSGGQGQAQPDYVYKNQYRGWAEGVSPQLIPRPPEPYKTFSETWSYADDGE